MYGPADATATHCLLLQIGFGFTFLVLVHPGSPGQNPESCKMVVVVVVVALLFVTDTENGNQWRELFTGHFETKRSCVTVAG